MPTSKQHLVLYDGTCGLCHRAVQFILRHDVNKMFMFAPLQGETAHELLYTQRPQIKALGVTTSPNHSLKNMDTLVLIENYSDKEHRNFLTYGDGVFRIYWLLGRWWMVPGILSFLPGFLYNWCYRWVARHRVDWFPKETCLIPLTKDPERFLL